MTPISKDSTAQGQGQHNAFRTAVGYFEEAVAIEPDFAEAYAALALTQMQFLFGGPFSPHETVPKAEAAARKALQLDETLAAAAPRARPDSESLPLALGGQRERACSAPPICRTVAMSPPWR